MKSGRGWKDWQTYDHDRQTSITCCNKDFDFIGCAKGEKLNHAGDKCVPSEVCPAGQFISTFGLHCKKTCEGNLQPVDGHCPIVRCEDPNKRLGKICCDARKFNINNKCEDGPCKSGTFKAVDSNICLKTCPTGQTANSQTNSCGKCFHAHTKKIHI